MAATRPAGLMRRLSHDLVQHVESEELLAAGTDASVFLDKAIMHFEEEATLEPVALSKLVQIQADAILLTLKHLATAKSK